MRVCDRGVRPLTLDRLGALAFTAIELLLAVVLLAILAVFASVAISDAVHTFRLSSASARLVHDIRFAQHQAMNRNGWYGVQFFADPVNQYRVYSTDGVTDSDVANPANRAQPLAVDLKVDFGVAINAINIGGGTKVEFNPLGQPYLDKDDQPLAMDGTVMIGSGDKIKMIQILKDTGRVDMPWN